MSFVEINTQQVRADGSTTIIPIEPRLTYRDMDILGRASHVMVLPYGASTKASVLSEPSCSVP